MKSEALLSHPTRGYFESTTPNDVVRILHTPSFESLTVDREIGGLALYWSYDAAAEGLNRRECTADKWACCGFSVEYRRFVLGAVRNENQFRFNFALANIGSFENLRRQEKLF